MEDSPLIPIPAAPNHTVHIDQYGSTLPARTLLRAVLNNDIVQIGNIFEHQPKELFYHKYEDRDSRTIIIIACLDEHVSEECLDELIALKICHFGSLDLTDENWYHWEPMHYAASVANPRKLSVLLRHTEENKRNCLTVFSENALHILLAYSRYVDSYPLQLFNESQNKLVAITTTEKADTVRCAKLLVDAHIDVNHNNFWNETPIHLAIKYRQLEIIEMLLRQPLIDIDTYKDLTTGKSARELLTENEICWNVLPQATISIRSPSKRLFTFLKNGDEESFLRYEDGNIMHHCNSVDGDNEWNTSGTMLHYCFRKGYLECIQGRRTAAGRDIMKTDMLKVFCSKGLAKCIVHLLVNEANAKWRNRKFQTNLLEVAALCDYYPFLVLLLEVQPSQFGAEDIFAVISRLLKAPLDISPERRYVLFLLLDKLQLIEDGNNGNINYVHLNILNRTLKTLDLGEDDDNYDRENVFKVLKLGASLSSKTKDAMAIENIGYGILEEHLNECIDDDSICYDNLIQDEPTKYSETVIIRYMAQDSKKSELLNHPALIFLIHNKWLRLQWFFYLNFTLCTLFLVFLYMYMLNLQQRRNNTFVSITFVILIIINMIKEVVQLFMVYRCKYLKDFSNWLDLLVLGNSIVTLFVKYEVCMVAAILLSTVNFLSMLGELPKFTKYMIIFGSTKYFFEYAIFYLLQFVSFAVCFFILFPSENKSEVSIPNEIVQRMFETLIFFTGEFNETILKSESFPVAGRILVTVFIFFMTIILNNLLVGLIVTDMDKIQKTGKLYKQMKMAKFITRMESFLRQVNVCKSAGLLNNILQHTDIFQRGKRKFLSFDDCVHKLFDEEDKNNLKQIANKKTMAISKHSVQSLYDYILSEERNEQKVIKGRNKDILKKLNSLENKMDIYLNQK